MTNNEKTEQELEAELEWKESTASRDAFKKKNSIVAKTIEKGLIAINSAISVYNNSIGLIPGIKKIEKLKVKQTAEELAESGGSSLALGLVDDAIKLGRWGLSKAPSFSKWLVIAAEKALLTTEFAIDHLKDLMTSSAISGLAAEVGDLKDGQAKLNAKVDAQGKLMTKRMGDMKAELKDDIKAQGEKFDQEIKELEKEIGKCSGEIKKEKEERKAEIKKMKQEMETMASEITENINRVEKNLTNALKDFKEEVNERFEQQERKIIANKKKIEEERIKREAEVKEIKDKIKIGEQKAENLQQQLEENEDKFDKYKSQIDQKTAETQQNIEDAQAEYERKTKIIEVQIEDNQEKLEEFNEEINNVRREQAFQRVQQEEILEELQETNDNLFAQQRKLNLVAEQMDDIQEEVHERMDKLSQKLDDRINETLNIAQDTIKKVDNLTEQVQNIEKETQELQEQIKKNKEETEKAKKEARLANERLDNLLKTQALMDFSAEENKLDKIQKSLELKAEETKLLATLNLLQETKKLITPELSEINWQVGIKKGKVKDMPREEGMLLNPKSSWAKKYTPEQLREWGWDTRLLGEHETAPLTDEEKRKEKQAQKNEQDSRAAGEESSLTQDTVEKIEKLKSETLERLAAVQADIRTGLEEIESSPAKPSEPSQTNAQKVFQASQKVKIKQKALEKQKKEEQQAKQKLAQTKKEEKEAKEKAQSKPTEENQQEAEKKKEETKQAEKEAKQEEKETEKAEKELQQAQGELSSLEKDQEYEEAEEKEKENQSEEVKEQWSQIQALSAQALQDQPQEKDEEEKELTEKETKDPLEELKIQLKKMEVAAAASQKTMSYFMLYLIIFLAEYIVYKRNGLPGLVILNIILAVCYYHRETLKEYAELWGSYLLIIGYVMGNVLAYSAPEQPKYKWPSVIGFNISIGLVYAYTLYRKYQEEKKIEAFYQQKAREIRQARNITDQEWKPKEVKWDENTWTGKIAANNPFSSRSEARFQEIDNLKQTILEKKVEAEKELEIQQQVETLQKAQEIEQQLKGNLEQIQEDLDDDAANWKKISHWNKQRKTPPEHLRNWGWENLKEKYPEFESKSILFGEFKEIENWLAREHDPKDRDLTIEFLEFKEEHGKLDHVWLSDQIGGPSLWKEAETLESLRKQKSRKGVEFESRLPIPREEEQILLSNLNLTLKQYIAISLKTPYLTREQEELIVNNYLDLNNQAKLQLLNAGLNELEINTFEKKEKLLELILTCQSEKEVFGLSTKEKEGVLRLLMDTLNLSPEQRKSLENMGIRFFDASNWKVSEEQKDHLLDFGLNKLELTGEQTEKLTVIHPDQFKTFSLTEPQKNILTNLAPLIKENKYSENSLDLFYQEIRMIETDKEKKKARVKPWFKNSTISFLVQEEIIPDPNTAFGISRSSYLPLKEKFLKGEQKTLRKAKEIEEKEISEEKLKDDKLSILRNLMNYAQEVETQQDLYKEEKKLNINLTLAEWVKEKALNSWQVDILLTCGFKTIPKYNFFELLIYAVEKFTEISWNEFLTGNENLAEEFENYSESLKTPEITINEEIWEKFVSSQSKGQREMIKKLNLKEMIEEQINQRLGNWKPSEEEIIIEEAETTEITQPSSSRYDDLLAGLNEEEAKRMKKKLEREGAQKKLEEQERQRRESKLSEKDRKLKEQEERRRKEKELAEAEEKKREESRTAREKALREEQEAYFNTKSKNIAERKKAIDEALENKKRENELEEKKKKDQIEKLEKENQEEQERLIKQSKLIEEEAQKRMAAIALEDEEQRQEIEKRAKIERSRIEEEMNERKRKHDAEMKKRENELLKEKEEKEAEIREMENARVMAEKEANDLQNARNDEIQAQERLRSVVESKGREMDKNRQMEYEKERKVQRAMNAILWYPMLEEEWKRSVRGASHNGNNMRLYEVIDRSGVSFNISNFQFDSGKWTTGGSSSTWTYSQAEELRKAIYVCENRWIHGKSELENILKTKWKTLL